MKKVLLFLCFVCAFKFVSAQEYWDICKGETFYWNVAVNTTDTVIYFSSFTDSISYLNNRIYDTIVGDILSATVDTDMIYEVVSVNGIPPEYQKMLVITILPIPTISIPQASIHHVTCPDGAFYPYMDGGFHIDLDDPVQNYEWINISNDSIFFFVQTYDSVTLTNLKSGTYHVVAYGTNGCMYHDSVTIEQPEAWYEDDVIERMDIVCFGQTGCIGSGDFGGTPPYNFTWFYYSDTGQVFLQDTTRLICGLYSGRFYGLYMYDSRGCKAFGEEIDYILFNLYEYVEDSTHIITTDPIACYGQEFTVQAQSIGEGTYSWHVGDVTDSVNYWTGIEGDTMFVAEYHTPPLSGPTWVSATFTDQNGCVTHDSVFVQVDHPVLVSDIPSHLCANGEFPLDLNLYTEATPPGGALFYSGDGLSGYGQFTPESSGAYTIYMDYTDTVGCIVGDTTVIQVVEPEPLDLEVDSLMFTDSLYYVNVPPGCLLQINGVEIGETGTQVTIDPSQFAPGYYTLHCEVTLGEYDCLSEYDVTVHIVDRTSIREFDRVVSVYPNPATSVLTLSCTETVDIDLHLLDITGKVIKTEKMLTQNFTFDVSDLSSGMYMLRLVSDDGASKIVKFVKK